MQGGAVIGGVSSYGWSGTLAHAVVRGFSADADNTPAPLASGHLIVHRRSFGWMEPQHALLQRRLEPAPAPHDAVFASPSSGAFFREVADHMVQGRVIIPGAGFLEIARAAGCSAAATAERAAALRNAFFLQPLALDDELLVVECALSGSLFEVRSTESDGGSPKIHCSGTWALTMTTGSPWHQQTDLARAQLNKAVSPHAIYDAYHSIGLQYGPSFHTHIQSWASHDCGAAQLRPFRGLYGSRMHPADVDGALQLQL
eukprot:6667099-Prymnesium_polylepis.1